MGSNQNINADAVISKLKDDGDFDRLRLKIIRLLKQNEDLRSNISSVVKQSAALNCDGAENMKPRQLCDAIHDEVCEKTMSQISDALWEIIQSGNGMKSEITETVQSVYLQLLYPGGKPNGESPSGSGQVPASTEAELNTHVVVSQENNYVVLPNEELKDSNAHGNSQSETQQPVPSVGNSLEQGTDRHGSNGTVQNGDGDHRRSPPPGFSSLEQSPHGNDEDPDIPPGFG